MPNYDYRCTSCDNFYEKREGFDAPATQTCPRCGASARRVLSAPLIIFKGSGFYVTDSRKNGGGDATIGAGGESSTPSAEASAPTESAPVSTAPDSE